MRANINLRHFFVVLKVFSLICFSNLTIFLSLLNLAVFPRTVFHEMGFSEDFRVSVFLNHDVISYCSLAKSISYALTDTFNSDAGSLIIECLDQEQSTAVEKRKPPKRTITPLANGSRPKIVSRLHVNAHSIAHSGL